MTGTGLGPTGTGPGPTRIAIAQALVVPGGRLQVILGIARAARRLGYAPELVCLRLDPGTRARLTDGQAGDLPFREIGRGFPLGDHELATPVFHRRLATVTPEYALVVNSDNTPVLWPLGGGPPTLHYVHFPREYRLFFEAQAGAGRRAIGVRGRVRWWILAQLHRGSRFGSGDRVVANSLYTRSAIRRAFPEVAAGRVSVEVVYPPVATVGLRTAQIRAPAAVTVGRFAPAKGQLEQIRLARGLDGVALHAVGFTGHDAYWRRCAAAAAATPGVHLHPNLDAEGLAAKLAASRYYLHTARGEPFGITVAEAIAAGCVPVVHDSGGPREIVPVAWLRYDDLREVPSIVARLEAFSDVEREALAAALRCHVQANFSAERFETRIGALLTAMLAGLPMRDKR